MNKRQARLVMLVCAAVLTACFGGSGGGDSSGGGAASGGTTGATGGTTAASGGTGATGGSSGGTGATGGTGAGGGAAGGGTGATGGSAGFGGIGGAGASGGAGGAAGVGGSGGSSGTGGGSMCTPTCFRAYTCAASCAEEPFDNGCCTCPAGTIDTITCMNAAQGSCGIGCTGAAPDPGVEAACAAIETQSECQAYEATEFPYGCTWLVPPIEPCLAP